MTLVTMGRPSLRTCLFTIDDSSRYLAMMLARVVEGRSFGIASLSLKLIQLMTLGGRGAPFLWDVMNCVANLAGLVLR